MALMTFLNQPIYQCTGLLLEQLIQRIRLLYKWNFNLYFDHQ